MKRWVALLVSFLSPCLGYTPWYTGTFLEFSGANTAPGHTYLETFTSATVVFGEFQNNWSLDSSANPTSFTTNTVWFGWGMTKWLDFTLVGSLVYADGGDFGTSTYFAPIQLFFGLQFAQSDPETWCPYVRLLLVEEFPSTPYDDLGPNMSFAPVSNGSFVTGFSFIIDKILFLKTMHPTDFCLNLNYSYQTKAHITGVSIFGGDIQTDMQTHPGGIYSVNLSIQISLNQNWVFESDINYTYQGAPSLTGNLGSDSPATPTLASQLISLTPGFEYNFSQSLGVFAGAWVTPWGQNTNGIFGVYFSFDGNF